MLAYSSFMASHAPGGFDWYDYHAQRLFNSAEYLRLNGYLTNYGFSIWSSCIDCSLTGENWRSEIYLSGSDLLGFWPYLTVNHFFGRNTLLFIGPLIDKTVIFITAVIVAEFFIRFVGSSQISKESTSLDKQSPPFRPGGSASQYSLYSLRPSGPIRCSAPCGTRFGFCFSSAFLFSHSCATGLR